MLVDDHGREKLDDSIVVRRRVCMYSPGQVTAVEANKAAHCVLPQIITSLDGGCQKLLRARQEHGEYGY